MCIDALRGKKSADEWPQWMSPTFMAMNAQNNAKTEAQQVRQQVEDSEANRQATIRGGQQAIDNNFAQFNDPYYANFERSYYDAYNPQVDQQYDRAKSKATAQLADRGVLESSIAANTFGDLAETAGNARGMVAGNAADAVAGFKGRVNDAKSTLYALNTGAQDPTQVSTQARATTQSLIPQQSLSPLGDIFAGALAPLATAVKANMYGPSPLSTPSFNLAPNRGGSSRVIT